MTTEAVYTDNRDPREMISYLEARVAALKQRNAELEDDLEYINRQLVLRDQMIESLAG